MPTFFCLGSFSDAAAVEVDCVSAACEFVPPESEEDDEEEAVFGEEECLASADALAADAD